MSKRYNRWLNFNFDYIPNGEFRVTQYLVNDNINVDIFANDDPYDSAVFVKNGVPICVEIMILDHKAWYTDLLLDTEFIDYLESL